MSKKTTSPISSKRRGRPCISRYSCRIKRGFIPRERSSLAPTPISWSISWCIIPRYHSSIHHSSIHHSSIHSMSHSKAHSILHSPSLLSYPISRYNSCSIMHCSRYPLPRCRFSVTTVTSSPGFFIYPSRSLPSAT